jgi:hypothetical protein
VLQMADGVRFVVDCNVKPVALVGQVKITFPSADLIVRSGRGTGNEMLKTVPFPELPPPAAVP